jgi:hypothetical protein
MKIISFTKEKGRALSVHAQISRLEIQISDHKREERKIRNYDKKYGTNILAETNDQHRRQIIVLENFIQFLKTLIVVEEA